MEDPDFKLKGGHRLNTLSLVVCQITKTQAKHLYETRSRIVKDIVDNAYTALVGASRGYENYIAFLAEGFAAKTDEFDLGYDRAWLIGEVRIDSRRTWPGMLEALADDRPFERSALIFHAETSRVKMPMDVVSFMPSPKTSDKPTVLPRASVDGIRRLDLSLMPAEVAAAAARLERNLAEADALGSELRAAYASTGEAARTINGFAYRSELVRAFEPARQLFPQQTSRAGMALLQSLS